ncbi:MAG: transglutaminase-like cysteine peptidase [Mesorhizobium sp.]
MLGAAGATSISTPMAGGPRTTQPIGHYEFCQKLPKECAQRSYAKPLTLTRAMWAKVVKINNDVNAEVEPVTDQEMWGVEELWSYPVNGKGDCEDYVLEKRRRLMELGVPAGNLLITVVRQRNGAGHAVLTVRTDLGDFVLDNLEDKVLDWTVTNYTFLKRQSERNSGVWVSINDSRAIAVGSVNN